jgi:hypothetical protein
MQLLRSQLNWNNLILLCFVGGVAGCEGIIGDVAPGAGAPRGSQEFICQDPGSIELGSAPVRRLTNVEYENTVRDLLGGSMPPLPEQPSDVVLEGSFENDATSLGPSDVRIARYEIAATELGEYAANDSEVRARILPCDPVDDPAACGRTFVESFGRRTFRRPLTAEELDRWGSFFEQQRSSIDFDAAIQLTVAGMLQSPQFLYRLEDQADPMDQDQLLLTQYEVANRLSYLLWETMPDDELLEAAARNELETEAQIEAQARRMLADNRARAAIRNFHRQWLDLDRVLDDDKVPELFPMWSEQAQWSAREESLQFIERTVLEGGTISDLLTSNVAYVDDVMAELYGLSAPDEPWSPVELDPRERAGILSRIAFLAGRAHSANGSPPLRGVYVMDRILCEPRLSPPADADVSVPEQDPDLGPRTNRQLFEERTAPSTCQGCHVRIDGFGFGFEDYDAAGIFRTLDNGLPVDASGVVVGIGNDGPYDGAVELQSLLADSEVVHDCVVRQWFTYAYGRSPEPADACQVEALQQSFLDNGGSIIELLVDIVTQPEFRLRSGWGA